MDICEAWNDASADEFERLSSTMDGVKYEHFNAKLESQGKSFSDLTDDLRTLGADTTRFAELSDEDLKKVAAAYEQFAKEVVEIGKK